MVCDRLRTTFDGLSAGADGERNPSVKGVQPIAFGPSKLLRRRTRHAETTLDERGRRARTPATANAQGASELARRQLGVTSEWTRCVRAQAEGT